MTTLAVTTKIEQIIENSRLNVQNLYKAFDFSSITIRSPLSLAPEEIKTIDVTASNFLFIVLDDFGTENEVIELTLTNDVPASLTIEELSFYMGSIKNITEIQLKNTSITDSVDVYLVY